MVTEVVPFEAAGINWKAARVQAMPADFGTGGHYRISTMTGDIAAGAGSNSEVFQFRWTSSTLLALPLRLICTGMRATTAFAAGVIDINCMFARSFTAAGTGGGTATITGNNAKVRTSHATTGVAEIRTATTAALGAGTKTMDAQPLGQITTHSSGGVGSATPIIGSIYLPNTDLFFPHTADGAHPLVLAQNEGIIVRATVPATGVWNIGFTMQWAEVLAY